MASRRLVSLLFLGTFLASTLPGQAADGINFFKNYFVTGDYVVGSVDLKPQQAVGGLVSGTIPMSGVPANADILAAFMYFETITDGTPTSIQGTFRGNDISPFAIPLGRTTPAASTAPCWAKQGNTNSILTTWRVDVLRFLPIGSNAGAPSYGKRLVNDADLTAQGESPHTIQLPDSGTGNQLPESAGASLVVIYRDPSLPLTGIVIYEGFHYEPVTGTMSQTLRGFFERAPGAVGKLTQLVSSGQPNPSEQVSVNNALLASVINPFNSSPSSQRGWRDLTIPSLDLSGDGSTAAYGEEITTAVTHTDTTQEECLGWTGFLFSAPVRDDDRDGLLNIWESPAVSSLHDPDDTPLPNLYAMRARPTVQDIFIEIGYMQAPAHTRYGPLDGTGNCVDPVCEEDPVGHTHLPAKDALDLVAWAFRRAYSPRAGNISGPINIHFDVGSNYQTSLPNDATCLSTDNTNWNPSCAIIPAAYARGGESIAESACPPNITCLFPDHPGSVSWKVGYRLIREQPLNYATESDCAHASDCVRRFDWNRRYMFRYALFAHALAVPLGTTDDPSTPYDERHTPVKTSGIGDLPGGDIMVTLGRWDDFTGTSFMQASTLMHEFGHTGTLKHGGITGQPNCKSNYQTVMNYLFQARGLFTITGNQTSDPLVDYSRQALPALQETSLNETTGLGSMAYATRWYAPWGSSLIDTTLVTSPATRHCDGTLLSSAELTDATATPPGPLAMARVDGTTMSGAIDWSADGTANNPSVSQDISFSGSKTALGQGVNDWALLDLRHVGSRRNVAGLSANGFVGALSIQGFAGDNIGFAGDNIGFAGDNLGLDQTASGADVGFAGDNLGFAGDNIGFAGDNLGDAGLGDQGRGEVVPDAPGAPKGDLNLDTALGFGNAPHIPKATWVKQTKTVTITIRRPHVGKTLFYELYRVPGGLPITAATLAQRVQVGTPWPYPAGTTSTVDISDTNVQNNQTYTYFALAIMENPDGPSAPNVRSGISNYKVVTTK